MASIDEQIDKIRDSIKDKIDRIITAHNNPVKKDINTCISETEEKLSELKREYALLEKKINTYEDLLRRLQECKQNPHAFSYAVHLDKIISTGSESPYFKAHLEKLEKIMNSFLES